MHNSMGSRRRHVYATGSDSGEGLEQPNPSDMSCSRHAAPHGGSFRGGAGRIRALRACLLAALALPAAWRSGSALHRRLLLRQLMASPIETPSAVAIAEYGLQRAAADGELLRQITSGCTTSPGEALWLDRAGRAILRAPAGAAAIEAQQCPLLDVLLPASARVRGMLCADAARFVLHAGARLLPELPDAAAYDAACGRTTARLFFDGAVLMQLVAHHRRRLGGTMPAQLLLVDAAHIREASISLLHRGMTALLCRSEACETAARSALLATRTWTPIWRIGHAAPVSGLMASVGVWGRNSDNSSGNSSDNDSKSNSYDSDVLAGCRVEVTGSALGRYAITATPPPAAVEPLVTLEQLETCWQHRGATLPLLMVLRPPGPDGAQTDSGGNGSNSSGGEGGQAGRITYYPPTGQPWDDAHAAALSAAAAMHIVLPGLDEVETLAAIDTARASGAIAIVEAGRHGADVALPGPGSGGRTPPHGSGVVATPPASARQGAAGADWLCAAAAASSAAAAALTQGEVAAAGAALSAAHLVDAAAAAHRLGQLRAVLAASAARMGRRAGSSRDAAVVDAAAASLALAAGSITTAVAGAAGNAWATAPRTLSSAALHHRISSGSTAACSAVV